MRLPLLPFRLLALAALLFAAGCERAGLPFAAEESDDNFIRGKSLLKQGRDQEALAAFLKVIAKRAEDAPESHLEVGLLYLQHIKDPIAAIYHFNKFLELQPNSRQAELVRQRREAAKREFARSLPANPLEAGVKVEYSDQLERLQRENEQLKAEIADLRVGLAAETVPSRQRPAPAESTAQLIVPRQVQVQPAPDASPIVRAPLNPSPLTPVRSAPEPTVRSLPPTRPPGTATPNQPAVGGRRHTVQHGDTLSVISQRYYGTKSRWREIYNANRDLLKTENDTLVLGMELKIP
jgi:tetratricopeptide (TPR) repeat protein